ncbi:hypothetical protein H4582DRAFT_1973371 [Lactarius indigo]|nr:hypothetical protein H4582DRAFT_1973371 [Lactarius indigo]
MLSPLRLPSLSTLATPPSTPTPTQLSRPPASSYFRSMPQRTSIRQITRTVTYASIARLSSDITPAVAMPITPRKGSPGPLWVTLSKARRTPDTPRKGQQHATFAYGLPSPVSPLTRRIRPSSVRISRLPIPPFTVSTPPRRANPASRASGDRMVTPSSECYPTTPTSSRGVPYPWSSPRSPLSRKSSSTEFDIAKNQSFRKSPLSSTVLQLYVRRIWSSKQGKSKASGRGSSGQPTVGVQPVSDVTSLRVAQTTRAPVLEPQVAQVEAMARGTRGLQSIGAHPSSDGHGDAARSSESASSNTLVRARPTRQPNERMARPQSTPPVSLRLPADSQKFMPLMRTRSVLSRITGKAKVASTPDYEPWHLVRNNITRKRGETRLPQLRSMRNLFRRI